MKKTYISPNLSIQYVSLHSAIMSANPGLGGNTDPDAGLSAPARTLYF